MEKVKDKNRAHGSSLPVAPSMEPVIEASHIKTERGPVDRRVLLISLLSIGLGLVATGIAQTLTRLIGFFTNLAFFHRFSLEFIDPGKAPDWGLWVVIVPVIGGLVVGLMARYGSKAIRGHGIPEAMEQVLTNESRIPWRMVFLKPISAAIAIGTGGPFGAEGPIIATGGALGSWLGQVLKTTASERKTLLAAGAAAGMTATFGSPISAVLLAVELLVFEFRPRSLVPLALAAVTANSARIAIDGAHPAFVMPVIENLQGGAVVFYGAMGVIVGVAAVLITRAVYWVEDNFEHLPVHWMWWPAIGGLVVGAIGYFFPRTMGVGYANIEEILGGGFAPKALAVFCAMKFLSWVISLGSGTSGGTLAPLFTIGGGMGALLGVAGQSFFPGLGIDPKVSALVGMAALFAGASRALLASVVFAFETTRQPFGLLPLLSGCTIAYLIASYLMRNSIMTEKIARRGIRVPTEYAPDFLEQIKVGQVCTRVLHSIAADETLRSVREKMNEGVPEFSHQGFPVLKEDGRLIGVLTRRDLLRVDLDPSAKLGGLFYRTPIVVFEDQTLREAADLMTSESIGRLPVVTRDEPKTPIGIITRSDLLAAHQIRLRESRERSGKIDLPSLKWARRQ